MTVVIQEGRAVPGQVVNKVWKERIAEARTDRRRYEPNWAMARAFAAGKHWLRWSRKQRRLVLPPNTSGADRYSVEEIGQYRLTAVGELSHDDTWPTLAFRNSDIETEEFTKQANDALGYALQEEANADEIALDLKFAVVDLGTSAIRCLYDGDAGSVYGHQLIGADGNPVTDPSAEAHLEEHGTMPDGSLPKYKQIHDGLIRLEIGVPENLLVPAGIEYQRDFPWEIWVRPVLIQDLIDEYGAAAADLKEEPLSGVQMLNGREMAGYTDGDPNDSTDAGRLKDHVLVYTCYERPSKKKPDGEMIVLAGSDELRPLTAPAPLPYVGPDGKRRSGITYFHYQRVPGRFWGRGLVEVLKDPQRMIDKRRTQMSQTIDRAQPYMLVEKGSMSFEGKTGSPMEIYEVDPGAAPPQPVQGLQPGPWMQAEVDSCREDMTRASGIQAVSLGENPTGVLTFSQLSLLRENDQIKRLPLQIRWRSAIAEVVENVVYDIRTFWGSQKQLTIAGTTGGILQAEVFDATKVPTFFKVEVPSGSPKPVSQGAKLQMIQDIANFSTQARTPVPVPWYIDSLKAGEPLDLPADAADSQKSLAEFENTLLMQGLQVEISDYDNDVVHLVEHRAAEDLARAAGDEAAAAAIAQHCIAHIRKQAALAAQVQQAGQDTADAQQQAAQLPPPPTSAPPGPPEAGAPPV